MAHADCDYDYVQPVPAALECPICRGTLDDPVQTPVCEHLYCRACLARALALAPSCPIDRIPLASLDHCKPAPRPVRQLLDDLVVRCARPDCHTECPREHWHAHARTCPTRPDPVPSTGEPQPCDLCHATIPAADFDAHPSACPAAHVPCAFCDLHLPRASHAAHLARTCPSVPVPCPHALRGCAFAAPRAALDDHLGAECAYEPLAAYLDAQDARVLELEGDNWALGARVARLEHAVESLLGVVGTLRGALGEYCPAQDPGPSSDSGPLGGAGADTSTGTGTNAGAASPPRAAASPPRAAAPRERRLGSPPPSSCAPPLPAALAALAAEHAALSASQGALAHTQAQHAQHAQHLADELAALRVQVNGVRMHLAGWMMQLRDREQLALLSSSSSPGVGLGAGRMGIGLRGRSASDEGRGDDALDPGAGAGGTTDPDLPLHSHAAGAMAIGMGMYGAPGPGPGPGQPLAPPPGMRFVPPHSLSPAELLAGGGWLGDPTGAGAGARVGMGTGIGIGMGMAAVGAGLGYVDAMGPPPRTMRGVPIPLGGAGAVKL
ncbi:hypothetical protein JCM3770_000793 [Rhodotorula araucariae]